VKYTNSTAELPLYITELRITNILNLRGFHILKFQKGLNIVHGPCSSENTNLGDAILFALYGSMLTLPRPPFIEENLREAKEKDQSTRAEVYLEISKNNQVYHIERDLSSLYLFEEETYNEHLSYSSTLNEVIHNKDFLDLIYINVNTILNETGDLSTLHWDVFKRYLDEKIRLNLKENIRLIILDNITSQLTAEDRNRLFEILLGYSLDQMLILEPEKTEQVQYHEYPLKRYRLGVDMESLQLTVNGFPFPAEKLRSRIQEVYHGYYLTEGTTSTHEVYDHEYTVTVTEEKPDGSRFCDTTKLIITEEENA